MTAWIMMMGTLAGQRKTSDGNLHVFFQFNDRGRGQRTNTVFIRDNNGNPVSEVIKGNDYLKADVDAEQGSKTIDRKTFYVVLNGPPGDSPRSVMNV